MPQADIDTEDDVEMIDQALYQQEPKMNAHDAMQQLIMQNLF